MPIAEAIAQTDAGLASVLRLAVMRLRRRLANERDPHNTLSLGQMSVLHALAKDGTRTLGDLAARERVQPPSMTRTVNCLEENGYVVRRSSESDRRQVLVGITEKGAAQVAADRERREAWLAEQLAALTPQETAVLRAAAPILAKLAEAE